MTTISTVERVFILGATEIKDLTPNAPLEDSVRLLTKTYPQFRHTKIYPEDGVLKNGRIEFTVTLPPAKSNG